MAERAVSIYDIAKIAGVSPSTVSNVLNDKGKASAKTRELVLRIAQEEGYVPNLAAKSLRDARSKLVGVVTPDVSNPFFSEIIVGVERELSSRGYVCCIATTQNQPKMMKRAVGSLMQHKVDGFVFIGGDEGTFEEVGDVEIPCCYIDRWRYAGGTYPSVRNDEQAMMRDATTHLIECGCTHIGMVMVSIAYGRGGVEERFPGYLEALRSHGIRVDKNLIMEAPHDRPSIERAQELVGSVLDDGYELDGIVAQGDRLALGALRALRERNLLPGRDVRVIGMDNSFVSEISHLSSIDRNTAELAKEGAAALLAQLDGRKACDVIVPHTIVKRGTTLERDCDDAYWADVVRVLRPER